MDGAHLLRQGELPLVRNLRADVHNIHRRFPPALGGGSNQVWSLTSFSAGRDVNSPVCKGRSKILQGGG